MKQFGQVTMTKEIENIIIGKVTELDHAYHFKIKGTPGWRKTTDESALNAWKKLKAWSEKNYAEATLVKNRYATASLMKDGYLLVKITDPTAFAIEQLLEEAETKQEVR